MNNTLQNLLILCGIIALFVLASFFQQIPNEATAPTDHISPIVSLIIVLLLAAAGGAMMMRGQHQKREQNLFGGDATSSLPKSLVRAFSATDQRVELIEDTLTKFDAPVKVVGVRVGPRLTQIEIRPLKKKNNRPVRIKDIKALSEDLALELATKIRIARVPNQNTIGIEIENKVNEEVAIKLTDISVELSKTGLEILLGVDITGKPFVVRVAKMPHVLIAGATGSGKSVLINSWLVSLLLRYRPDELKLVLIDPKQVELVPYNGIPHLVSPVVTDPQKALTALEWAVNEMEDRYTLLSSAKKRNIESFNASQEMHLPYLLIIIDELADLTMMDKGAIEKLIARLAGKARAVGIHLILATQRPSVDVVTGLIKANCPARISFAVASGTDSRVILDTTGAESLLGAGDMLYLAGTETAVRVQGLYVSDEEISSVVASWATGGAEIVDIFDNKPTTSHYQPLPATTSHSQPTTSHSQPTTSHSQPTTSPLPRAGSGMEAEPIDQKQEEALNLIRNGESFSAAIAAVYNTKGGNKFKRVSQELMAIIAQRV